MLGREAYKLCFTARPTHFTHTTHTSPWCGRPCSMRVCWHVRFLSCSSGAWQKMRMHNSIVKCSMSIGGIWQSILLHFGLQSTRCHFLDFADIKTEPGEKPADSYQRRASFVEDNLLEAGGNITHHGEKCTVDEELMPMVENIIVLTWLQLIHTHLPCLVKQCYCT